MHLWGPLIQEIAVISGENRERLMALLYRESWCSFAPGYEPKGDPVGWGDKRYAFGPFQIDRRYHSDFIIRELGRAEFTKLFGPPYRADRQALYACNVLANARKWFRQNTSLTSESLERATYAAYNAGPARVAAAVRAASIPPSSSDFVRVVDSVTTGRDYTKYIFALAQVLQDAKYSWIWS